MSVLFIIVMAIVLATGLFVGIYGTGSFCRWQPYKAFDLKGQYLDAPRTGLGPVAAHCTESVSGGMASQSCVMQECVMFGDAPSLPASADNRDVLCMGDSLMSGFCERLGSGRALVFAFSGATSSSMAFWVTHADVKGPRVSIVMLGTNDAATGAGLPEFRRNIQQIVSMLKRHGSRVILVVPPESDASRSAEIDSGMPERYAEVRQAIIESGTTMGIFVVDLATALVGDNAFRSDAVHPTASGYDKMAREFRTQCEGCV